MYADTEQSPLCNTRKGCMLIMVTINDIAKMAGVAKSTVSRYLNGGAVSEKTKAKLDESLPRTTINRINLPKA